MQGDDVPECDAARREGAGNELDLRDELAVGGRCAAGSVNECGAAAIIVAQRAEEEVEYRRVRNRHGRERTGKDHGYLL